MVNIQGAGNFFTIVRFQEKGLQLPKTGEGRANFARYA